MFLIVDAQVTDREMAGIARGTIHPAIPGRASGLPRAIAKHIKVQSEGKEAAN
jgi:hypothetical protein